MSNAVLVKSYQVTSVAIDPFLIVAATAGDKVLAATAATDLLRGTAGSMGAPADGLLDVDLVGTSKVKLGGTIANGEPITSDGASKGIKAVPTASTQVRIIGFALQAGVVGDIVDYHIAPGCLSKASA